ncbi:hypothetical protein ABZ777_14495 [Micromonospora parva]|uniref:hypothetical protein n=1 Tax=Micromonospora parva TaxID=1464048 RepID=UPI0033CFBB1E
MRNGEKNTGSQAGVGAGAGSNPAALLHELAVPTSTLELSGPRDGRPPALLDAATV